MSRDTLTTGQCAAILGVHSTNYVRDEIKAGRINGAIEVKGRGRTIYRVPVESFRAYCERYAPAALARFPSAAA